MGIPHQSLLCASPISDASPLAMLCVVFGPCVDPKIVSRGMVAQLSDNRRTSAGIALDPDSACSS
eukprot:6476049-Amphidinium_carterae.1